MKKSFSLASFQEGRALKIEAVPKDIPGMQKTIAGSGFVVIIDSIPYLITNRHNVEKNDYYTKELRIDEELNYLNVYAFRYNEYSALRLEVRNNGTQLFYGNEHKGRVTDVIALRMPQKSDQSKYDEINYKVDYDLKLEEEIFTISIFNSGGDNYRSFLLFGNIITNPDADITHNEYGVLPAFKINKHSLPGMSGSPVFVWPDKTKSPIFVGILSGNADGTAFVIRRSILIDLGEKIRNHE